MKNKIIQALEQAEYCLNPANSEIVTKEDTDRTLSAIRQALAEAGVAQPGVEVEVRQTRETRLTAQGALKSGRIGSLTFGLNASQRPATLREVMKLDVGNDFFSIDCAEVEDETRTIITATVKTEIHR